MLKFSKTKIDLSKYLGNYYYYFLDFELIDCRIIKITDIDYTNKKIKCEYTTGVLDSFQEKGVKGFVEYRFKDFLENLDKGFFNWVKNYRLSRK
ncbi:MAG: hypothetical protein ACOC3V_03480, partial [bacterium]